METVIKINLIEKFIRSLKSKFKNVYFSYITHEDGTYEIWYNSAVLKYKEESQGIIGECIKKYFWDNNFYDFFVDYNEYNSLALLSLKNGFINVKPYIDLSKEHLTTYNKIARTVYDLYDKSKDFKDIKCKLGYLKKESVKHIRDFSLLKSIFYLIKANDRFCSYKEGGF